MADDADSKNKTTTTCASRKAFREVWTILDESPVVSLKIEQDHPDQIAKFITNLINILLLASKGYKGPPSIASTGAAVFSRQIYGVR